MEKHGYINKDTYTGTYIQALYYSQLFTYCGSFPEFKFHEETGKKGPYPGPTL